jgi:hypothetical protein
MRQQQKQKSLLLEKDLRSIFIKKGLPSEMADWIHSVSEKYSPFVANNIFFKNPEYIQNPEEYIKTRRYLALLPSVNTIIKDLIANSDRPQLPTKPNDLDIETGNRLLQELDYIRDWYNDPERTDKSNHLTMSWTDSMQKSREYHEEQASKADNTTSLAIGQGEKVIVKFDDGYYWLNLNRNYCKSEADAMGHCGRTNGNLFSLRDRLGRPHITAGIDNNDKICYQIFGKGNSTPDEKYHKKILTLLGDLGIEKVKVLNYGNESFNVDQVDSDLKDWFEAEYDYYPTIGGVSKAELQRGEAIIDEGNKNSKYCSLSIDDSDDYINASGSVYIQLSLLEDGFWESEDGEKLRGKFGFNWTDENIEDNVLTFYTESGHFDMDKGTGYTLTRSSAEGYEEWCASVVSDIEDIDEEIDKTLERYFDDIFEKDDDGEYISKYANQFICLNRFDQLKSKNTYIDWNIGDNVIVNITKSDIKDKIPENMTKIMEQRITKVIKDAIISENNSFLHNPENDFYIIKPPSDSEIDRIIQQISVKTKISGSYVYKLKVMITLIDSTMEADEKAKSLEILNESLKTIYVEEINEIIDNYVRKAKGTTNESRSFSDFFFRYYS